MVKKHDEGTLYRTTSCHLYVTTIENDSSNIVLKTIEKFMKYLGEKDKDDDDDDDNDE